MSRSTSSFYPADNGTVAIALAQLGFSVTTTECRDTGNSRIVVFTVARRGRRVRLCLLHISNRKEVKLGVLPATQAHCLIADVRVGRLAVVHYLDDLVEKSGQLMATLLHKPPADAVPLAA